MGQHGRTTCPPTPSGAIARPDPGSSVHTRSGPGARAGDLLLASRTCRRRPDGEVGEEVRADCRPAYFDACPLDCPAWAEGPEGCLGRTTASVDAAMDRKTGMRARARTCLRPFRGRRRRCRRARRDGHEAARTTALGLRHGAVRCEGGWERRARGRRQTAKGQAS
jgi:hypothetical protein